MWSRNTNRKTEYRKPEGVGVVRKMKNEKDVKERWEQKNGQLLKTEQRRKKNNNKEEKKDLYAAQAERPY